jgi:ABC-2 type transport system permease protein
VSGFLDDTSVAPPVTGRRPSAWGALLYLYLRSASNRLGTQIARLKSPRYLLALLLGLGYFYLAIGRGAISEGRDSGYRGLSIDWISLVYSLFLLLPWVLFARAPQFAIAFTPAEVQWLLPAPLTRRELINAKLIKSQLSILVNVLVFMIILRGDVGQAAPWMRAIGFYLIFSTQTLHSLGAALTRAEAASDRDAGRGRLRLPLVLLATFVSLLVIAVVMALPELRLGARTPGGLIREIGDVLRSTPARVALFPMRALLGPVFADTPWQWLRALPLALLIPVLHYVWVVRTNVAFEEIATDASIRTAARSRRQRDSGGLSTSTPRRTMRMPALAATGRAEVAILWKNLAAAVRVGGLIGQVLVFTGLLVVLGVALVMVGGESSDLLLGVGSAWTAMFLFIGPVWNRFDLRFDLPRIAILRSWPISGARIVGAMIASTTAMHVVMIWTLLMVLTLLAWYTTDSWSGREILRLTLTIAVLVPSLSVLMFTVQNAAALLFPAWVRTGPQQRGIEAIGQNLLTMVATLLLVLIGLFYPAFVSAVVALFLWRPMGGAWALVPAFVAAFGVVVLQLVPAVRALGALFERTEPRDVLTDG